MSFDEYMGKERRRPYRGAKKIDRTCRNHGSCSWCEKKRTFRNRREEMTSREKLKEWEDEMAE